MLTIKGIYEIEIVKSNAVIRFESPNTIMNQGKDLMLRAGLGFSDATTKTWYMGLLDGSVPACVTNYADTPSSKGWTELVSYANATRPIWPPDTIDPVTLNVTAYNSSKITFTTNATCSVVGIALFDIPTKLATTGSLWCATKFSTAQALELGDIISVRYKVTLGG